MLKDKVLGFFKKKDKVTKPHLNKVAQTKIVQSNKGKILIINAILGIVAISAIAIF